MESHHVEKNHVFLEYVKGGEIERHYCQWRSQRGAEGTFAPPPKKERERERGGGGAVFRPSTNISAFIHSSIKCNKSLYIFTRCIALLVYLITFELLKQSTINQKTK
jgi:hypothetical protein